MSSCDQMTVYEGQVCLSELTRWQQCFTPQSDAYVYIPSDVDQQRAEDTANTLLRNLRLFLSPSPECVSAIRPFLRLYLFGSCDSNNQSHQVTQADCATLRDDVCAREWALAEGIVDLPICDELFKKEEECQGIYAPFLFYNHYKSSSFLNMHACMHVGSENSTVLMEQIMIEYTYETINHSRSGIVCAEGYYLSNDSLCRPLYSQWVDPPGVSLTLRDVAGIICFITALFSSITVITLALTIQRSTM